MIPVTRSDPSYYFSRRRRFWQDQQHWIPSSVCFKPIIGRKEEERKTRYASADELCAANVLISLAPKEEEPLQCGSSPPMMMNKKYRNLNSSFEFLAEHSPPRHQVVSDSGSVSTFEDSTSYHRRGASSPPSLVEERAWHSGSVSLALNEDDDALSPLHCFMRRYCVEAFSATPEDVATPRYGKSHGVKVVVGQVGIRCIYCKHRPINQRPERAVCFPSSLRNIYHSIETWQRRHSLVCKDITPWVRKSMVELMGSNNKSRAGGRRSYWGELQHNYMFFKKACLLFCERGKSLTFAFLSLR